jgi:hypothetical protein
MFGCKVRELVGPSSSGGDDMPDREPVRVQTRQAHVDRAPTTPAYRAVALEHESTRRDEALTATV